MEGGIQQRRPVRALVFAASLRTGSVNGRLAALAATTIEESGADAELAMMSDFDCPSYNGDEEAAGEFPAGAERFRDRLLDTDAFVIASPEYNASMPGMLKNVIDWSSRVRPQPFNERHALLLSASPSMVGGNRGLWALRMPLEHLGARVFPDMFSLAQAHTAFAPGGTLADEALQERFVHNMSAWIDQVEASKHYPCVKKRWVEYLGERPDPVIDRVE